MRGVTGAVSQWLINVSKRGRGSSQNRPQCWYVVNECLTIWPWDDFCPFSCAFACVWIWIWIFCLLASAAKICLYVVTLCGFQHASVPPTISSLPDKQQRGRGVFSLPPLSISPLVFRMCCLPACCPPLIPQTANQPALINFSLLAPLVPLPRLRPG